MYSLLLCPQGKHVLSGLNQINPLAVLMVFGMLSPNYTGLHIHSKEVGLLILINDTQVNNADYIKLITTKCESWQQTMSTNRKVTANGNTTL